MYNNEPLREFVEELKTNGFTVVTSSPEQNYSYCFFSKDDKIGYVEYDYMSGFSFTSVHKPNSNSGTGFSVSRDQSVATLKLAEETINLHAWIGYKVEKFKNLDAFLKYESKILSYRYL